MALEVPCPSINVSSQGLRVRIPGGVTLNASVPQISASRLTLSKNLVSQANAALAPLAPIFTMIDALLSVKEFAEAVPGLITNPGALAEAIAGLIENIDKLSSLVPQLSVPVLAVDLIDTIIEILAGYRETLQAITEQNARIATAAVAADLPGNEALGPILICAQQVSADMLADLAASSAPMNQFIGILNAFLGLIGVPEIPALDDIGEDAEAGFELIAAFERTLIAARDAIPVP